jgi:hypothetical protein
VKPEKHQISNFDPVMTYDMHPLAMTFAICSKFDEPVGLHGGVAGRSEVKTKGTMSNSDHNLEHSVGAFSCRSTVTLAPRILYGRSFRYSDNFHIKWSAIQSVLSFVL